ncbi:IS3 family transposase [Kordiimonas aestuarii]|uniref:IS3 family transposase n=1 Tax=Kordiimonas aestuarii TaxID=1005925 RepID=UPI00374D24CB
MSSGIRYTEEFKRDAVAQVVDRGYSVLEVATRLGISTKSLYDWKKRYHKPERQIRQEAADTAEIRRLKAELARVTEERDILKKATAYLAREGQVKYAFIKAHRGLFRVRVMCRVLLVHHSGFYAWLRLRLSNKAKDDRRLTGLIKQAWLESGCVYGYRKIHDDLRSIGETCSPNRVWRLARLAGIKAQVGYRRRPGSYGGSPTIVAPNQLQQQFDTAQPDQTWVTDITYIKTHEGFLYLAVVIDLYSRRVVGWSMQSRMHMDLVLSALLMAVWRRKPKSKVIIHSDQGSQFTSHEWQKFLQTHNLEASMSRRGNCHDNAVAESFFQLLKRERIRRRTYRDRTQARQDVFDYIEFFYNPKRKHGNNGMLSPVEFEQQQN